ncbi:hypothetical protein [Flavihumibacter solisilvae]|uniref:Uncharacterized protein n=1 Tax=Flavihumibacter solisilvae TaxID=1349421 RepID=A0A0C1IT08_9BACT|nr:hypothetical protein [Flavihumibacter solisilvae]KIC93549.1 hypothetical protein OI18_17575 [Flavihumibacter solisilvae]
MKRFFLPACLALSVVAAFAFKPTTYALYKANSSPLCIPETQCTVFQGDDCGHTVYSSDQGTNGACMTPVDYGRP